MSFCTLVQLVNCHLTGYIVHCLYCVLVALVNLLLKTMMMMMMMMMMMGQVYVSHVRHSNGRHHSSVRNEGDHEWLGSIGLNSYQGTGRNGLHMERSNRTGSAA